jgi:HAD superfamily hydrolase (TIGR01662 family)
MIHQIKKPVLFLDLDGTVRVPASGETFPKDINDQKLVDGIEDIMEKYDRWGWYIVGITNQAGVAYGFKTWSDVMNEQRILRDLFRKDLFDYIISAPCDPLGKVIPFNNKTLLRKPSIGMVAVIEYKLLCQGWIIDWDKSLFVGDSNEDRLCAGAAGLKFFHIEEFLKTNGEA